LLFENPRDPAFSLDTEPVPLERVVLGKAIQLAVQSRAELLKAVEEYKHLAGYSGNSGDHVSSALAGIVLEEIQLL